MIRIPIDTFGPKQRREINPSLKAPYHACFFCSKPSSLLFELSVADVSSDALRVEVSLRISCHILCKGTMNSCSSRARADEGNNKTSFGISCRSSGNETLDSILLTF